MWRIDALSIVILCHIHITDYKTNMLYFPNIRDSLEK